MDAGEVMNIHTTYWPLSELIVGESRIEVASVRRHSPQRSARHFPTARSTRNAAVQKALKIVSYVILALMAGAVVYAGLIGITYWTGIGV